MSLDNPLFRFGVIADVQHADVDDGWDFHHTRCRHYRASLSVLEKAVKEWNTTDILFVAQLGDLVDGLCKKDDKQNETMERILKVINAAKCQEWYHIIGNHELYSFSREELNKYLKTVRQSRSYYSTTPFDGFRLVVLDPYDISILGYPEGHPNRKQALELLQKNNPNDVLGNKDWLKGLKGVKKRFLPYNGAVGMEQLEWLRTTLQDSNKRNERVIVLSHIPCQPGSTHPQTLLWNFEQLKEVFHSTGNVVAYLAGHDHEGGYAQDEKGIHYVTFQAPLECDEGDVAFGTMDVYGDRLELRGFGKIPSRYFVPKV